MQFPKKHAVILGTVFIGLTLVGAGCDIVTTSNYTPPANQSAYKTEVQKVTDDQQRLVLATPVPTVSKSQERENIARRAKTFDVQNKVGYVYLVSFGKVMASYVITGKVSSLNSYITPLDRIAEYDGRPCKYSGTNCFVTSSPDIDGAYGENADGIFFFTTDGAYTEWRGEYMYSDAPLHLATPVELTREIK